MAIYFEGEGTSWVSPEGETEKTLHNPNREATRTDSWTSVVIQIWFLLEIITLVITVPVLGLKLPARWSCSPRPQNTQGAPESKDVLLVSHPTVWALFASYNKKSLIERSLEAIKYLDYPREKLQVVIADDSTDQTVEIIDAKVRELNADGIGP